ncbi:hypothetical protein BL07015 [Bacillus licheniformis DSM 13 = ATCC 14580]|uniref:Uncharacterized protein n=1 Tax=Bacillus licheniformis (strain ATCC 14580 / DSM 13 / JCM 2505 / CCUG 7422 / NBRC 12200 / NCIMB 9375 / NCTC 10341 / NRRL NRS-1264 / Gibson 46) TaxID=279010 RepID=Q65L84_BACLD|nr:hypothetical protein BL07015 [Bacillus licheniformis DSM 13 = ATCC 14580]
MRYIDSTSCSNKFIASPPYDGVCTRRKIGNKKTGCIPAFFDINRFSFFCRIRSLFSSLFLRKWTDDCWKRSLIGLAAFFSLVSLHSFLSHAYTPLYESSFHKLLMTNPHSIEPFGNDRFQYSSQAGDRKQKNQPFSNDRNKCVKNKQKRGTPHARAPIAAQQLADPRSHAFSFHDKIRFGLSRFFVFFFNLFMKQASKRRHDRVEHNQPRQPKYRDRK